LDKKAKLTLIRVWGTAGDTLTARTCVLSYFSVVTNKFSHLSVVNYLITKIKGFLREVGVVEWGEARQGRPVKRVDRASLRRPWGGETSHTQPALGRLESEPEDEVY
jgi:hypothetical protein